MREKTCGPAGKVKPEHFLGSTPNNFCWESAEYTELHSSQDSKWMSTVAFEGKTKAVTGIWYLEHNEGSNAIERAESRSSNRDGTFNLCRCGGHKRDSQHQTGEWSSVM